MATSKKNSKTVKDQQNIAMSYEIAMPQPANHLFEITLLIKLDQIDKKLLGDRQLTLKMPVWTPGSYLVREYSRHLQNFSASTPDHKILNWQKTSKNNWQIDLPATKKSQAIIVKYRVYANELTVRTNHLDATHGYFNSAALLFYIPGTEKQPIQIQIITPPHLAWQVTTPLPRIAEKPPTFLAPDFDTLVDSPFEIGEQQIFDFSVRGKNHQLVIYGDGNLVPNKIIPSIEKVIEEEAKIFGGLPYNHYIFLLHLSGDSYGGLEHKDCCSLIYPRLGFHQTEKKERFLQLVAHEFFHLWNIKRIRPKELETFDYEQENYTPSLWFSEGATSYYDLLIPQRAGIYNAKVFCKNLSQEITQLQTISGRKIQTVSESSWDAWIKLYRRDAYSNNNQISYYLKGELV
ncbi:MAG: M61 family metallopeptidase, partial [Microcoleaceae cyanobacterium]